MIQKQEPKTNPETMSSTLIIKGPKADVDKRNFKQ